MKKWWQSTEFSAAKGSKLSRVKQSMGTLALNYEFASCRRMEEALFS
jgi:hypothetical protein